VAQYHLHQLDGLLNMCIGAALQAKSVRCIHAHHEQPGASGFGRRTTSQFAGLIPVRQSLKSQRCRNGQHINRFPEGLEVDSFEPFRTNLLPFSGGYCRLLRSRWGNRGTATTLETGFSDPGSPVFQEPRVGPGETPPLATN
jgi:hypothetical protein